MQRRNSHNASGFPVTLFASEHVASSQALPQLANDFGALAFTGPMRTIYGAWIGAIRGFARPMKVTARAGHFFVIQWGSADRNMRVCTEQKSSR